MRQPVPEVAREDGKVAYTEEPTGRLMQEGHYTEPHRRREGLLSKWGGGQPTNKHASVGQKSEWRREKKFGVRGAKIRVKEAKIKFKEA